jgi:hypothetical protein
VSSHAFISLVFLTVRVDTDEYFRVFVGSIDVTLDGVKRTLTPADGEVHIPRRSVHSIHIHKDVYGEFGERADPNPIRKMRFLKHILTNGGQATPLTPVQAMRVFYEDGEHLLPRLRRGSWLISTPIIGDGFPSTGFKPFDICLVYVLGGLVGHFLGFGKIREAESAKTK